MTELEFQDLCRATSLALGKADTTELANSGQIEIDDVSGGIAEQRVGLNCNAFRYSSGAAGEDDIGEALLIFLRFEMRLSPLFRRRGRPHANRTNRWGEKPSMLWSGNDGFDSRLL